MLELGKTIMDFYCLTRRKDLSEKPYIYIDETCKKCGKCNKHITDLNWINVNKYNVAKIWKKLFVFCNQECYNNWINNY